MVGEEVSEGKKRAFLRTSWGACFLPEGKGPRAREIQKMTAGDGISNRRG